MSYQYTNKFSLNIVRQAHQSKSSLAPWFEFFFVIPLPELWGSPSWLDFCACDNLATVQVVKFWLLLLALVEEPAKQLCDVSSVLVGVELLISSRFQPSPLASKLLAASQKGEHFASVSPCQYIAYPQQVLCRAFSWWQVLLGTVRPQHWICKGESIWPNGEEGRWGQEKSQSCYGTGGHTKTFLGTNVHTQTPSGRRVLTDKAAGQICLQAGNISRRQQLQGPEDSLGRQQGAEEAEWPSLTRVEGTRQPWLATSLEEGKLQTETMLRQGPPSTLYDRLCWQQTHVRSCHYIIFCTFYYFEKYIPTAGRFP